MAVLGSSLCCDNCAQKQDHVIRCLEDQEDGDHSKDHLDGLIPFKVTSVVKGPEDAAVAEGHNQERKHKTQSNLTRLDGDTKRVRVAGERGAGVVIDGGVHHFWYGEDQGQHPDQSG